MERLKILRSYLSSPPPPPPSPPSPPSSESPPNSPTTDQPESPQPTMITTTNSTETTSPISTGTFGEDFTDLRRFNSRIQKSFNDSTKRITNLLQFRSISATKPSSPPSEMTVNHVNQMAIKNSGLNKGKQFLRSKSNVVESSSNGIKNGNKSHRKENGNDEKIEETEDSTNKHHNSPHNHNHHHHQHLSKKKVLSEDKISSDFIINTLNEDLDVLIAYFLADFNQNGGSVNYLETSDVCGAVYYQLALHTQKTLARCTIFATEIELNCPKYEYEGIKASGYRSLLRMYESCLRRLLLVVHDLNEKKSRRFYFKLMTTNLKDFQSWLRLLDKFEILLEMSVDLQKCTNDTHSLNSSQTTASNRPWRSQGPSLFVHSSQMVNTDLEFRLYEVASQLDAFFGKVCGFQFCDSLQLPMTACAIALASYNDGFEMFAPTNSSANSSPTQQSSPRANSPTNTNTATPVTSISNGNNINGADMNGNTPVPYATPTVVVTNNVGTGAGNVVSNNVPNNNLSISSTIGRAAMSFMSSTKYIMDPDLRAKKMSHVMRRANVEFCKEFWQLTETSIVQISSNLANPKTAINVVKAINLSKTFRLPKSNTDSSEKIKSAELNPSDQFVNINPPKNNGANETVNIRIISHEMRKGMQELDHLKTVDYAVSSHNYSQSSLTNYISTAMEPSKCLMLHAHGGGFIAQSSKSHEIYLRPWARELRIPIVSIDYSLAPEHCFPKASEECFYVYCWCLLNKEALGWTGEKIICVGDSAGGILVTNIVQRAISAGVRIPDALVPIYAPFLSTYSLSPSRLMSIMDPVLNFGILWRCLAAYCGIDFKTESENYRNILNSLNDASTADSNKKTTKLNKVSKPGSVDSNEFVNINISDVQLSVNNSTKKTNSEPELSEMINNKKPLRSSSSDESTEQESRDRLVKLHAIMGDSICLVEKLRIHELPYDQYISPLMTDDSIIAKFPRTCLITTSLDPLLDDSIEFEKMLRRLNVQNHNLIVFNNLNHGFLNFIGVSKDCRRASKTILENIKNIIDDSPINETVKLV